MVERSLKEPVKPAREMLRTVEWALQEDTALKEEHDWMEEMHQTVEVTVLAEKADVDRRLDPGIPLEPTAPRGLRLQVAWISRGPLGGLG
jgi:hypothetical protein